MLRSICEACLVGWEHFKRSIIKICSAPEQGARENYYLQKHLALSSFSCSFSESQIYETLATNKEKIIIQFM